MAAAGILARAVPFVTEGGFAVASADVPGHGDRPKHEEYNRIATQIPARVAAGEDLAPVQAEFQALVSRQTGPEWQAVLNALAEHVGAGPVGYWGMSLGCGLWDDERVPRARSLALFDAFGSADKTLHANPGKHADRLPGSALRQCASTP